MNGAVPAFSAAPSASGAPATRAGVSGGGAAYGLLFIPFAFSWVLAVAPAVSYLVAWAGSFWILYLTIGGHIKPLPQDRSLFDQILRPIVLTQLVFVGYGFISSIFHFLDVNGYYYLALNPFHTTTPGAVELIAQAQRYYVLAHAGVAMGMLVAMDYRRSGEWVVRRLENPAAFLLIVSAVSFFLAQAFSGPLGQIGGRIERLGLVASVLGLAVAVPTRRGGLLAIASWVFAVNLGAAFLSGWKEEVLVMVMLLAVFVYPYARRTVLIGAPIALIFLLAILPTYAKVFRELNWEGTASQEEAASVAFGVVRGGQQNLAANNWKFLTSRASEIGLFTQYISSINNGADFYGTQILEQGLESIIPRAFWRAKPITENLVMRRVYDNGVVSRTSSVSAKPQYVVDGYLSAGPIGMFLGAFLFGWLASRASRFSERFFGGYFWGTGLIYTSFFAIFWKANSFEFFINIVVWSFILLIPLMWIARSTGLLVRAGQAAPEARPAPAPQSMLPMRRVWGA